MYLSTNSNKDNPVKWKGQLLEDETTKMREELTKIHTDLAELLAIKETTLVRKRRIAASALAFGAVSALGGGMALGTSLACTLKGIFGTCTN